MQVHNNQNDHQFAPTNGKLHPEMPVVLSHNTAEDGTAVTSRPTMRDLVDRIPRNRDRYGNRLRWSYYYGIPLVDDQPLAQTPLAELVRQVTEVAPTFAAAFHHFYDHRLLPTRQRAQAIRSEEEQWLIRYNAESAEANTQIDKVKAGIAQEYAPKLQSLQEKRGGISEVLDEAHLAATKTLAAAGTTYHLEHPDQDIAAVRHHHEARIAAREGLPWTPTDVDAVFPKVMEWLLECIVGAVVGISVGIMARWIYPDALLQTPVLFVACVVFGMAAAMGAGKAIILFFKHASELCYLRVSLGKRVAMLTAACGYTATVLGVDACVEQNGLLAVMRTQAMVEGLAGKGPGTASGINSLAFFLSAVLLTIGYVGYHAWVGILRGRRDIVINEIRLKGLPQPGGWESDAMIAAMDAVSAVTVQQYRLAQIDGQITAINTQLQQEQAEYESRRRPIMEQLSDVATKRIQDALDDLQGAMEQFERLLMTALALTDGLEVTSGETPVHRLRKQQRQPNFWQTIKRWLAR
ncbi:MAG TPA: hypothetical protein VGL77_10480 [Armatimonadota bacterium]